MAVRGARRLEDGGTVNWTRVDVAPGKSWEAHVAGDVIGIDGHFCGRSIPCMKRYFGKAAQCEGCAKPLPVDLILYVPLYRGIDSKPVFVICHKDQQDVCDRLTHLQQVRVGRMEEAQAGIYIQPCMRQEKFVTGAEWKKRPANLAEYLPTVWRLRGAITCEIILRGPLVDQPMQLLGDEPPAKQLSPTATVELSAAVVGQQFTVAGQDAPPPLDGPMADVFKRRGLPTTPKKNGKH